MLGLLRKGTDEKLLSDTLNNLQEFSVQVRLELFWVQSL